MDKERLATYANWALARIENDEDPMSMDAFGDHVANLQGDRGNLGLYGWPSLQVYYAPVDVRAIAEHAEAIKGIVAPFV